MTAAATAAELIDPDLLKVAKTDLPPEGAMCDLVRRFSRAFRADHSSKFEQAVEAKRPKLYDHMTLAEHWAFCEQHRIPMPLLPVR